MNVTLFVIVIVLSSILHFSIQKIFIYYKRFDDFNHRSSHKTLATRTGGIEVNHWRIIVIGDGVCVSIIATERSIAGVR